MMETRELVSAPVIIKIQRGGTNWVTLERTSATREEKIIRRTQPHTRPLACRKEGGGCRQQKKKKMQPAVCTGLAETTGRDSAGGRILTISLGTRETLGRHSKQHLN